MSTSGIPGEGGYWAGDCDDCCGCPEWDACCGNDEEGSQENDLYEIEFSTAENVDEAPPFCTPCDSCPGIANAVVLVRHVVEEIPDELSCSWESDKIAGATCTAEFDVDYYVSAHVYKGAYGTEPYRKCRRHVEVVLWSGTTIPGLPGVFYVQLGVWNDFDIKTTDGCGEWELTIDTAASPGYDEGCTCVYGPVTMRRVTT